MRRCIASIVVIVFGLAVFSEPMASERQFPLHSKSTQQSNSRVFGQGQAESEPESASLRTFGNVKTIKLPGTTFSNRDTSQPTNTAKVFPSALLESMAVVGRATIEPSIEENIAIVSDIENPTEQIANLSSLNITPNSSQLNNNEPEVSFTESFLSDPARVGGLVGGITLGAVFIHPLAPIVGNVLGYLVGKKSDYSEQDQAAAQKKHTVRPIATTTEPVQVIKLGNN